MNFYEDDLLVKEVTEEVIKHSGSRLLQIQRLADHDTLHVIEVMKFWNVAPDARVIDIGCGIGEFARCVKVFRPNIQFTLCNPSQQQLAMIAPDIGTPAHFPAEQCHLAAGDCDTAFVTYALGHFDLPAFWASLNSTKVTCLCVYDLFWTRPNDAGQILGYNMIHPGDFVFAAAVAGWQLEKYREPDTLTPDWFWAIAPEDALDDALSVLMCFKRSEPLGELTG